MSLALHLRLAGAALIALALLHAAFPRRFRWKEELPRLSLLNRQMFVVHSFFIAVTLALFGVLSFVLADGLAAPDRLSRTLLCGMATFWTLRLGVQLFVYDRQLWRGDRFHTVVHVAFSALWTYLASVYATAFWLQTR